MSNNMKYNWFFRGVDTSDNTLFDSLEDLLRSVEKHKTEFYMVRDGKGVQGIVGVQCIWEHEHGDRCEPVKHHYLEAGVHCAAYLDDDMHGDWSCLNTPDLYLEEWNEYYRKYKAVRKELEA